MAASNAIPYSGDLFAPPLDTFTGARRPEWLDQKREPAVAHRTGGLSPPRRHLTGGGVAPCARVRRCRPPAIRGATGGTHSISTPSHHVPRHDSRQPRRAIARDTPAAAQRSENRTASPLGQVEDGDRDERGRIAD